MTIKSIKEKKVLPLEIDLTSEQGDTFYLLGVANELCKQIGLDSKVILEEMKTGDYKHFIEVFDREFGDFVTLYR